MHTVSALIGQGPRLYTVDSQGGVRAWATDLTEAWQLDPGPTGVNGSVDSAPNIDVARDNAGAKDCSKPGTFYVASTGAGPFDQIMLDGRHSLRADEPVAAGGGDSGNKPPINQVMDSILGMALQLPALRSIGETIGLGDIMVDGGDIYWIEGRPGVVFTRPRSQP